MTAHGRSTGGMALDGVQVVEFGHYAAGPMLGMLLADQGATVTKVEPPAGDPARRWPVFAVWNRGKGSVVADLKTNAGRRRASELMSLADVVIENYRPGVSERLGIDYAAAARSNASVVYCSLPGYPAVSMERRRPGWDAVIAAATANHLRGRMDEKPLYSPQLMPSAFAAIIGAGAIAAALIVRQASGAGQRIEVPLYSAMFAAMGRPLVRMSDARATDPFAGPQLPIGGFYRCRDGRYVQSQGPVPRQVAAFLRVAGRPEWIRDATAILYRASSYEEVERWRSRFAELFLMKESWEWERLINDAGGACTVCRSVDEWLATPHARQAELVIEVSDRTWGSMSQPGIAVNLRGTPGRVRGGAPLLGDHHEDVRREVGAPRGQASTPSPNETAPVPAAPLSGVRVLDLCIIIAGPTCGRQLAEYGADVIKIDDPARFRDAFGALDVNRGKRSLLLDLRSDRGREIFWRLVDTADVVTENFRSGTLDRLGLGYDAIRKRKPGIVYAHMDAYGSGGEFEGWSGWDANAQAVSGIHVRRGGRGGVPVAYPYPAQDYGTGLLAAYGVLLAVFHHRRTGVGQRLDLGLASTASLMQSRYFFDHPGYRRDDPEGPDLLGESWSSRLYCAADGWFLLWGTDLGLWRRLQALPELTDLTTDARYGSADDRAQQQDQLIADLSRVFSTRPCVHWVDRLSTDDVTVVANRTLDQLWSDDLPRQAGLLVERPHPDRGMVGHVGVIPVLDRTPAQLGRPSPRYGADTPDILRELGYSSDEIGWLIDAGVVEG